MSPLLLAVALPLAFALVALATPSERVRPWWIPVAAAAQLPLLGGLVRTGGPVAAEPRLASPHAAAAPKSPRGRSTSTVMTIR